MPMGDLGLAGAYGAGAVTDTLEKMIARRRLAELDAARQQQEAVRQQQEDARLSLQQQEIGQRAEEFRTTNERLLQAQKDRDAERVQTNLEQLSGRIKENTPIGAWVGPQNVATLQKAGEGGLLHEDTPIVTPAGLVGRLAYSGTGQQQRQAASDALAERRQTELETRDEANRTHQQVVEDQANRRLGLLEARGAGGDQPLTPLQTATQTRLLANDWHRYIAPQRIIERQFNTMNAALKEVDAGRPFGADEAILVSFERALDPNSVVRESEYARAGGGMAVLDQLEGLVKRARSGGAAVPPQLLHQIVGLAGQFVKAEQQYNAQEKQRVTDVATSMKINPELVFGREPTTAPTDDRNPPPTPVSPGADAAPNPGAFIIKKR